MENQTTMILKNIAYPADYIKDFDDVIIKSKFLDKYSSILLQNIVEEYNNGKPNIMTESVFGTRIEPNQFRFVAINKQCILIPPSKKPLRKKLFFKPTTCTEEIGTYDQLSLFLGEYGSYIINVPIGKLALCWKGNMPIIYDQGPHVIHDQNFHRITNKNLHDYNSDYINHGIYHIIRIYPNSYGKIWINNTPYFLTSSAKPYIFREPTFKFDGVFNIDEPYINHGPYHILRVPSGKIAKVWLGSTKSILLESSNTPYEFCDPTFSIVKNGDDLFVDATTQYILHGSTKRLLPKTGQVAVTYDNGKLVIYGPNKNGSPIVITGNEHSFDRFISINTQTIQFPSDETIEKRIKEDRDNNDMDDEINYEVFRTSDGLTIGVKILVIYEIGNPSLTFDKLNPDQIQNHIEHIVVADMGTVIQNCSSVDFLKSNPYQSEKNEMLLFYKHLQEDIFNHLQKDFALYGINLIRLNLETPKIIDKLISKKLAENSLITTDIRTQESLLDKKFNISKQEANTEVTKRQIIQDQENKAIIYKAETELSAIKLQTEAILIKENTLLDISKRKAELYKAYPCLFELELTKLKTQNMENIKTMVISPEIAKMCYNIPFTENIMNFTTNQSIN